VFSLYIIGIVPNGGSGASLSVEGGTPTKGKTGAMPVAALYTAYLISKQVVDRLFVEDGAMILMRKEGVAFLVASAKLFISHGNMGRAKNKAFSHLQNSFG
jgi:hypothetical protein